MKETIVDSKLTETIEQWRIAEAKIHKECSEAVWSWWYNVDINIHFNLEGNYDDAKQDVLKYFNKLKLDTSKLLIDSNGNPVVIDPKVNIPIADVPKQEGPYVVLSWSTEKPKRKVGRPKGSKTKKQDIKKDLEKKAAKKSQSLIHITSLVIYLKIIYSVKLDIDNFIL